SAIAQPGGDATDRGLPDRAVALRQPLQLLLDGFGRTDGRLARAAGRGGDCLPQPGDRARSPLPPAAEIRDVMQGLVSLARAAGRGQFPRSTNAAQQSFYDMPVGGPGVRESLARRSRVTAAPELAQRLREQQKRPLFRILIIEPVEIGVAAELEK